MFFLKLSDSVLILRHRLFGSKLYSKLLYENNFLNLSFFYITLRNEDEEADLAYIRNQQEQEFIITSKYN